MSGAAPLLRADQGVVGARRQHLAQVASLVRDCDEAIADFIQVLDFELVEDSDLGPGKRWAVVAPQGAREIRLLLAKSAMARQRRRVGEQAAGRVFLSLQTDDFWRDFRKLQSRGVSFLEQPHQ